MIRSETVIKLVLAVGDKSAVHCLSLSRTEEHIILSCIHLWFTHTNVQTKQNKTKHNFINEITQTEAFSGIRT